MNKLAHRTKLFMRRNGSTILTCMGGAGVIATVIMAVQATPKALELIKQAETEKGEKLTKVEVVKAAGATYIPTAIMGGTTLACIFGANVLNKRQQAALMSAYALMDASYKEYRAKVTDIYGEDGDSKVREEIAKDKYDGADIVLEDNNKLFYDEFSGRYFEAPMERVIKAEYEINKKITQWGGAEVNEFYEWLDIPQLDAVNNMGWSTGGLMADTWNNWVDFKHNKVVLDDGLECYLISAWPEPMYDYEYY